MSSSSTSSPAAKPLSSPPELSIHPIRISSITRGTSQPPAVVTPTESYVPKDDLNICGKEERSGRWSEDEHNVFLDGLDKHGKQWKTIAAMIGTRTVVQVRTHAQKYFHKLERTRQKSVPRPTTARPIPQAKKRKSVPPPPVTLTTKKSKRVQEKLSKIKEATTSAMLPPPVLVEKIAETTTWAPEPTHVVSTTVSETDSVESSPSGLEDLDVNFDEAQMALDLLGDEPLEWLIDGNTHSLLPESSLPPLPFDEVEDALRSNMVDANLTMSSLLSIDHEED